MLCCIYEEMVGSLKYVYVKQPLNKGSYKDPMKSGSCRYGQLHLCICMTQDNLQGVTHLDELGLIVHLRV